MKLFVLSILFFITFANISKANYPYYYFNEKKTKISSKNFYRYIIPQAQALVKEYYHILKKLNPLHQDMLELKKKAQELRHRYFNRKKGCYKTPGLCKYELTRIYKISMGIDQILLNIKTRHSQLTSKSLKGFTDELLLASKKIDQLLNYNYQLLHMLEEQLLVLNTRFEIHSKSKKNMNQAILKIMSLSQMIITIFVPPKYKQEFDSLWITFITQIEKYILRDKNKKYLIKHLGELNIAWNTYHMKLSKGNLNFPVKLLKIISIQHNRWNSILKVILRR